MRRPVNGTWGFSTEEARVRFMFIQECYADRSTFEILLPSFQFNIVKTNNFILTSLQMGD